ncbi:hypothetical protein [Achromobacter xylosoxidans]|jgi:hypothetical protein|uniref:hypothetical protein n=1 Tax=Alcaligenes xylosoxydans xylosoxydans TaxID=85698 RepID=UPI0006C64FDB|nr:hypothetical protein [Achromobacter xylosoxidans]QQE58266.1 hypothetical protein I6H41_04325 [Achromobacter xylosoxidans]QQV12013.1 hypothetical protein I6I48_19455 [Achromobacter xylosoxidans]UXL07872.1 hypothetical protein N4T34_14545 [Achromobacter xylosoxidans]CUI43298.1 Uncharacterised protein [Achromobacter xylosoxidans]CUI98949.1 Uncharacterised protein [Achromobacter xylosoxidans]
MRGRILNYLRSIQWHDPGTVAFMIDLVQIVAIVIVLILVAIAAIRNWLFA